MPEVTQAILIGVIIIGLFLLFLFWWKKPKGKLSKRIEKLWLRLLKRRKTK